MSDAVLPTSDFDNRNAPRLSWSRGFPNHADAATSPRPTSAGTTAPPSARLSIGAAVVATVALFAGLTLNWYGMLPWHGPMSGGLDQVGGVTATVATQAGHKVSYASMWVYNPSRVAVTLDSVEPVVANDGLRVVDAWLPPVTRTAGG